MVRRQTTGRMGWPAAALVMACALWAQPVECGPADRPAPRAAARAERGRPGRIAIHAGEIYTAAEPGSKEPPKIEEGWILIEEGRIAAIGPSIEIPAGTETIDCSGEVVIPGLVLASGDFEASSAGRETASAKYRAVDDFDPYQDRRELLSGGVTALHLSPGPQRLLSGLDAVVKTAGVAGEDRVLAEGGALCVNLGPGSLNPPGLQEYPLPASSTNPIQPAAPQRPTSRMGQLLELRETFQDALDYATSRASADPAARAAFNYDKECLAKALKTARLRVEARRSEDIAAALRLLESLGGHGYLTGATEASAWAPEIARFTLGVVLEVPVSFNQPFSDIGWDPDPMEERLETAAALSRAGVPLALALPRDARAEDLLPAAAAALRGGLSFEAALSAVTRVPARLLGVEDRVGSLEVGKDADLVVLSGEPFKTQTHVLRVYSSGAEVFTHPALGASLVIRAGKILTASGPAIENGAVLIEEGKIRSVGESVPLPPGARVLDAGPDAVVTPGFIDCHGHLGLEGDASSPGPEIAPADALALPEAPFRRVAAAGITTVMLAPRGGSTRGAQISAIKTAGERPGSLVLKTGAGLKFSFRDQDPMLAADALRSGLKAGRDYADKWKKYYEDLAKWEKEQAEKAKAAADAEAEAQAQGSGGESTETKKPKETENSETPKQDQAAPGPEEIPPDPITGTWEYEVRGGPLPEPQQGVFKLRLEGNRITGSGKIFFQGDREVALEGTLNGADVHMEIDMDTPAGRPAIDARLDGEDHMTGKVTLGRYMSLDYEANRTEKAAPKLKVSSRKKQQSPDGRPLPPERNEALEPFRDLVEGRTTALVDASSAAEIEKVLQVFKEEFGIAVGLLNANDAWRIPDAIRKAEATVVLPREVVATRDGRPAVLAVDLARARIPIAFQSDAEDGARSLPLNAAYAVHQGLDPLEALRAFTLYPARLFKIEDRVGSLEPGKDADLVIFSGDPFELGSAVLHVFVGGREVGP